MLSIQKLLRPLNHSCKYLKLAQCGPISLSCHGIHSKPKFLTLGEETKAAFKNLSDIKDAPASALFFGTSGLIPFTSIPAYMLASGAYIPELAYSSLTYSAVILSFLGGVRWGSAIPSPEGTSILKPDWKNLGWAVTPSLIGWSSLLVTNFTGSLLVISGFLLCLVQDVNMKYYPSWYKSLRIMLSTVAIVALIATLICQQCLPVESKTEQKL